MLSEIGGGASTIDAVRTGVLASGVEGAGREGSPEDGRGDGRSPGRTQDAYGVVVRRFIPFWRSCAACRWAKATG